MKCPFRLNKSNIYAEMETSNGKVTVLDSIEEYYPDCYESECAFWRWSVEHGGYYCAQAMMLDDNIDFGVNEEEET